MYLTRVKGLFVQALKATLDDTYPVESLRNMHVSIEYPIDEAKYPSIWVDYDDTAPLVRAGVDHRELVEGDGRTFFITRWRFTGYVTLTIAALSSLERDQAYDELVGMIAFARQDSERGRFVDYVEQNDYVAVNVDTDTIQPRGAVAAPGTPWGTDEVIYERTINLSVIGEFVPDPRPDSEDLLLLSAIKVEIFNVSDPDQADELADADTGLGPKQWH